PECRWLDDGETLTYLHACVSTKCHRVRVPEVPMYLDALLADQPLTGGLEPQLGNAHLRILTVVGFPSVTTPGLLEELNALSFAYRWSTRAIMLDKTDAVKLLTKIRRQWFAKRKSIAAILKEVMTNEASALVDTDAHNKAMDADAALQELGSYLIGEAYVTTTVTVWHADPRIADESDGPAAWMIDQEVVRGLYYAQTPADGTPKQKADARRQQFKRALDWAEAQELIASHEIDDVVYLRLCSHEAGEPNA